MIHHEYPDLWPDCFESILSFIDGRQEISLVVVEALCVVFQECDDRLSRSTPLLFPVLFNLYKDSQNERTRVKII